MIKKNNIFDKNNKIKKFFSDFGFNFLATSLPLAILTLLIYPKMAKNLGVFKYGIALSIIGYFKMSSGILISNLGYNRLLEEKKSLKELNIQNYNIIFFVFLIFTIIFSFSIIIIMNISFKIEEYFILGFTIFFLCLDTYLSIEFRISINFYNVLKNKIFLVIGYLVGLYLNNKGYHWLNIFLMGYIFATIYDLIATTLWKQPLSINKNFKTVFVSVLILSLASFISSISTYFDKLVLFPKLGGSAVAIYSTTALIAKIGPSTTGAIGNVLLSYFVKMNKFNKKQYGLFIFTISIIAIIGYFVCYFLSFYFLTYFYPQILNNCLEILKPVVIIYMAQVFISLLYPYLLCYCKLHFQIIQQIVRLVLYVFFTIPMMNKYGLNGFSIGVLFASIFYVVFMIIVGYLSSIK
ncbi:hypothetical protein EOM09_00985 [bacterium]|nr:hypothetical protein [bacterium]